MGGEWHTLTVDQIKADGNRAIAIGPFGSRMKADAYVAKGVPVIRGNNISDTRVFVDDFVFVSDQTADELRSCNVFAGDLVFPHRGAIGRVGLIPDDGPPRYMLSTSLMKLTCNRKMVDPQFIFYFFRSSVGRHALLEHASTVGTPGIGQPLTSLRSIRVPVPPLDEQRAIARILGTLDDKIELNRRMNETLEAIARALFKSWFVDFNPVRAKVEARDPGLPQPLADLFPDSFEDSELGEIPKGWSAGTFGQLAADNRNAIVDGPFGTQMKVGEYQSTGVPVIEMPYLEGVPFYRPFKNFLSEDKFEEVKRSTVLPGDIAISKTGTLGLLGVMTDMYPKAVLVSRLAKITAHADKSDPYFILGVLKEKQASDYWGRVSSGSTMPMINLGHIKGAPTVIPPSGIQKTYGNVAKAIYSRVRATNCESTALTTLRDTVLPKLISGEVRLKHA